MRVLLLIDDLSNTAVHDEAEFLLYRLDRTRIQTTIGSLHPGISGIDYSINTRRLLDFAASYRLAKLIREQDIELIHVLDERSIYNAVLAGLLADRPVLVSIHHIAPETTFLRRLVQRFGWRLLQHLIARVIVPSELMQRRFRRVTEFPRERIDIIYPSITGITTPSEAERSFLALPEHPLICIPIWQSDDGYNAIFDALPRVKQRVPDANTIVIGKQSALSTWQRRFANSRPTFPIRWLTDVERMPAVLASSDVIVMHTSQDRWPDELVMAVMYGRPVVAPRVSGVTEIIESAITGLLVTPGDVRDLALQTVRLLTQPEYAQRLGLRAQEQARKTFSPERRRDTLTTLYEATIYASR
ncbi:MAG: glycosyltransferase family 4 protein [Anaerolineae bacterium]